MRGIHKARDQRPCATTGCGCRQFRAGGASASAAPPRVVPGTVEREPLPVAEAGDDLADVVTRRGPREAVALANFAVHLNARMRALGWDQAKLMERADIKTPQIAARAINGTGCDLGLAERIAAAVGGYLATMIGPYMCSTCTGEPPAGFACLECGAESRPA
jgi:hypothetical protein